MAKKQEGNEAVKNNKLEEAYNLYTNALDIDPLNTLTNAKLYFNRAIVNAKVLLLLLFYFLKSKPFFGSI
jgi:DnaJ family protein C protein 7